MDITTLVGIVAGVASLVLAFVLEGGEVTALFEVTAAMIVFGGTIGATMTSYSLQEILTVPKLLVIALTDRKLDLEGTVEMLTRMAEKARKEGLLVLEQEVAATADPFMKQGLRLLVDAADPELIRGILETQIEALERRHKTGIGIFEAAGGFAPTMGIIGTVMGLVHVLSNLSSPEELGPSIAVAFIATLYGVSSANLLWLPIAAKLRNKHEKEKLLRELTLEGIMAIHAGERPAYIQEKLAAFLHARTAAAEAREEL